MTRSTRLAVAAALLVAAAAPPLQATPLPPGSTNVLPTPATLANTTLLGTRTLTYTGVNALGETRYVATLTNQVFRDNATGTVLFTYQVTNSAGSTDPIDRLSTTNFDAFTVDFSATGFGPSTRGDRSPNGAVVGFNDFGPAGPTNALDPGETSALLVLRTNALAFTNGTTELIDGAVSTGVTFAPLAIVPEPGAFALAAVGLPLAVGCYRRVRRGRAATP
jgi:hypothetical protein